MTRRQLLQLAAAAPAAAAVTGAAPVPVFPAGVSLPTVTMGSLEGWIPAQALADQNRLFATLFQAMDEMSRARAIRHNEAIGVISAEIARQAAELDT